MDKEKLRFIARSCKSILARRPTYEEYYQKSLRPRSRSMGQQADEIISDLPRQLKHAIGSQQENYTIRTNDFNQATWEQKVVLKPDTISFFIVESLIKMGVPFATSYSWGDRILITIPLTKNERVGEPIDV